MNTVRYIILHAMDPDRLTEEIAIRLAHLYCKIYSEHESTLLGIKEGSPQDAPERPIPELLYQVFDSGWTPGSHMCLPNPIHMSLIFGLDHDECLPHMTHW